MSPAREGSEQTSLGSLRSHLRARISSGEGGKSIQLVQKPCGDGRVGGVVRAEHRVGEGGREEDAVGWAHPQRLWGQAQDCRLRLVANIPISQMRKERHRDVK